MLRSALLWASTNPFLAQRLPRQAFVRRATRRFMPGEHRDDALRAAEALREAGAAATLTLLGENLRSEGEADQVVEHYLEVLSAIATAGLDVEVSMKLTQLGLDFGTEGAERRLGQVAAACPPGSLVWVDMEASSYVDRTLEVFRSVQGRSSNVGLCVQAYLRRTAEDVEHLLPLRPALRLVKGAYREPEEVAFPSKADVDRNFVRLLRVLLEARAHGQAGRPVVASHDPRMIEEANRIAREVGLARDEYEFGMLYGIQAAEQRRLAREGFAVRVLVSYGEAWFPWYMRRLAERPANLWFVVRQLLG